MGLGLRAAGHTGSLAGGGPQGDCSKLGQLVVLWRGNSVWALPLCYGVTDAEPGALDGPEGGEGVVVTGVPCPSKRMCVRQETEPCKAPCDSPRTPGQERGMETGVTPPHIHQHSVLALAASLYWAICPTVPVEWGGSAERSGGWTETWAGGPRSLLLLSCPPAALRNKSINNSAAEVSFLARCLSLPAIGTKR